MTVQMTKGPLSYVPNYTNTIRIEANFMHGDMNAFSSEVVSYQRDQQSEINFDLEGLAFIRAECGGPVERDQEKVRAFYAKNKNFYQPQEWVEDFIEQFVIQDSTDDSWERAAKLDDVNVFLYDENGAKFTMAVTVDGVPLHD